MSVDREQLKRDCADALEALLKEQRLTGLTPLADRLRSLGPAYRQHGDTVTWHLIHTLEKLEQGT